MVDVTKQNIQTSDRYHFHYSLINVSLDVGNAFVTKALQSILIVQLFADSPGQPGRPGKINYQAD